MIVRLIGWMLIHSLWQGALVALLLAAGLRLLPRASASTRYLVSLAALSATVVIPLATMRVHHDRPSMRGAAGRAIVAPVRVAVGARPASVGPTPALARMPAARVTAHAMADRLDRALPGIVAAWLVGVVVMALRLVGGVAHARRCAGEGTTSADAAIVTTARTIAARLGLRRVIPVRRSTRVDAPMVVGWVAPVVLIPASLLTGLTPAQLAMVFAHEMAHIPRHDPIVNLMQRDVETLLFYHPAVWWVSRRVRDERESCCDDLAIAVIGTDGATYGAMLLRLAESRLRTPALATAATEGSLLRRVRRLVDRPHDHRAHAEPRRPWRSTMLVVTTVTVVVALTAITELTAAHRARQRLAVATEPPRSTAVAAVAAVAAATTTADQNAYNTVTAFRFR